MSRVAKALTEGQSVCHASERIAHIRVCCGTKIRPRMNRLVLFLYNLWTRVSG